MLEALTGKLEGGRPVVSVTVGARAPESEVADLLRETEAAHPGVAIGSYPFFKDGRYGVEFRDPLGGRRAGAARPGKIWPNASERPASIRSTAASDDEHAIGPADFVVGGCCGDGK